MLTWAWSTSRNTTRAETDRCLIRTKRAINSCWANFQFLVPFIFFSADEKMLTCTARQSPAWLRYYAPRETKKRDIAAERLLGTRPTLSKSAITILLGLSVTVSNLGYIELIFGDPGIRVNTAYRCVNRCSAVAIQVACHWSPDSPDRRLVFFSAASATWQQSIYEA